MGYTFNLEHVNIVSYLTAPIDWHSFDREELYRYEHMLFDFYDRYFMEFPERLFHHKILFRHHRQREFPNMESKKNYPRFSRENVLGFLYSLNQSHDSRIISHTDKFPEILRRASEKSIEFLHRSDADIEDDGFLNYETLKRALFELKFIFGSFAYYGLVVGSRKDKNLSDFFRKVARDSGELGLFLIPDDIHTGSLSVLDPFPQISLISKHPELYPGIIFWSSDGTSTIVPSNEAEEFTSTLINASFNNYFEIPRLIQEYESNKLRQKSSLLHLSDLHFGSNNARANKDYLLLHINKIKIDFTIVVLSGVLCDNPFSTDFEEYKDFKLKLKHITVKNPIVVLGNHDHKILGIIPTIKKNDFGTDSNYPSIVKDHKMKCLFFCFDSCIEVQLFAGGKISQSQLTKMAILFERECLKKPEIRDYFRIAVIHHHPLPYQSGREQEIQTGWKAVFSMANEQFFLKMENGDNFVKWCAEFGIKAILHGHKHWQRYVEKNVSTQQNRNARIRAIGCGTSSGKGGKPMTYNLVSWDNNSQAWGAIFFQDHNRSGYFSKNMMLFVVN
ncbi:MAG: metallophosphoesterase [Candidatus Sericytochromatia bacterium]